MEAVYRDIKRDRQIWKFGFYGFFKNLKFFEPYLYIYLMSLGVSLFQIGVLLSIREIVVNIFEVPSGIFADNYGKKTELLLCFVFYIVSFLLFFIGTDFAMLVIAFIFFGLGEAFRSGTHKAMIYRYLEQKGWFAHKAYVYGRTRSFSLMGSSLSAFISILLVLNLPGMRWIFLLCIVPYLLDFTLILSYPDYLNERVETDMSFKKFLINSVEQLRGIAGNKKLTRVLLSSSLFSGIFKTIKDYIQPILKAAFLLAGGSLFVSLDADSKLKVFLGVLYGVFFIFSSMASRNVHRLKGWRSSAKLMHISFDVTAALSLLLFCAIGRGIVWLVIGVFFILYIVRDARRPLVVDVCGDYMDKKERATVMSIDSQLTSIFMAISAPLFGFIADNISIQAVFLCIAVFMIFINRFLRLQE